MLSAQLALLSALLVGAQPAARPPIKHDVVVDAYHLAVWQKRGAQPRAAILLLHVRPCTSSIAARGCAARFCHTASLCPSTSTS